jgi:hypothetical protein
VRVIEHGAFWKCIVLVNVEFGDELETIGGNAFNYTHRSKECKVWYIGRRAFEFCEELTEVKLSKNLVTIGNGAFWSCRRLRRIATLLRICLSNHYRPNNLHRTANPTCNFLLFANYITIPTFVVLLSKSSQQVYDDHSLHPSSLPWMRIHRYSFHQHHHDQESE